VARKKSDYSEDSGEERRSTVSGRRPALKAKPEGSAANDRAKRHLNVERADGERRPRVEKGSSYRPKRRAGTSRSEEDFRSGRSAVSGQRPALKAKPEGSAVNGSRPEDGLKERPAGAKRQTANGERQTGKPLSPKKYPSRRGVKFKPNSEKDGIRLNKYIANAGICSRREADELITAGVIKVNGVVVTTLGSKVMPEDKVQYGDQSISNEKKRYLLLNKQKGYVTTTKDPHAKNTVMELIEGACRERIYPVGRLDRNTTGLLLFTNDGDLAKKLMHPSSRIRKMYHVVLDQPVSKADMLKIAEGIALDDDRVQVDGIAYVEDAKDRREIGLELHSGQNRVVRRIFESLGYKVTKLDRVVYAGLTKKGIPRGKWRFLSDQEVIRLKMLR
jgi:23S rRNA pseudouridine2605 synthase